jgi:predicted transcriptional regulator
MSAARRKPARKRSSRQPRRQRGKPRQQLSEPSRQGTTSPQPRKTYFELPPLELECMKALWALEQARPAGSGTSVREIRARVAADHRPLAYTTVETIMDRLTRKGAVARRKQGKAHRYTVLYQRSAARAQGVAALVKHFFDGSRRALHAYLAGQPIVERAPLRRAAPPPQKSGRGARHPLEPTQQTRPGGPARRSPAHKDKRPQPSESPLDTSLL